MPIAHAEIMSEVAPVQVGTQNEAVLVHLVGVVGDEPDASCECVLSNHVPLNQLRLHHPLFFFRCNQLLCLALRRGGRRRLKLRGELYLVVVYLRKVGRLVDLEWLARFQLLQFMA